jgi:methylthioribulose-1-phosphate dehydratase
VIINDELKVRAAELIEAGRYIHSRGWVPATSGNLSARLSDGRIAITVSGKHKGELVLDDIMLINSEGCSLDGKKPSAEARLHTSLYSHCPAMQGVLHLHSLNATLASRLFREELVLEGYELLKALPGIETHESRVVIPIFPNDQDIPRLAACVERYMNSHQAVYGYIIAGHGFYTWGSSVREALRHGEALEFLFECEIRMQGVKAT